MDFERGRVDAGREGVDLDGLGRAADVDGGKAVTGKAADGGRQIEGLLHIALQAIRLGEHVAREQGSVHGENLHSRVERSAGGVSSASGVRGRNAFGGLKRRIVEFVRPVLCWPPEPASVQLKSACSGLTERVRQLPVAVCQPALWGEHHGHALHSRLYA